MMNERNRREFLGAAGAAGLAVLLPSSVSCVGKGTGTKTVPTNPDSKALPLAKPSDWDPVAFNKVRGNAGAIPESYLPDINGTDGVKKHLGKHLPYVPQIEATPAGALPLMWGDPSMGYAKHPNAPVSEKLPEGHWYNWIRVRPAVDGAAEEIESVFTSWPLIGAGDNGKYAALDGDDPAADEGRNTVYVVALPPGVEAGAWVRIHAHCLTHGEYLDFVQVPA